jgi:sulfate permease, SulP family
MTSAATAPPPGPLLRLLPGLTWVAGYRRAWLRPDLMAGLAVWAVLVPQALANGELAGLPPVNGLYTAAAALLLYPLFGSSRVLSSGPESAVSIVVAATVVPMAAGSSSQATSLAAALALLVAAFLVFGALLRAGVLARLLSTPILGGYLTGSAIIIISSQVPKLLGVSQAEPTWYGKLSQSLRSLTSVNGWALAVGLLAIAVMLATRRWLRGMPAALFAVVVATAVTAVGDLASKHAVPVVGTVARGVPVPTLPAVTLSQLRDLVVPAASIALLVLASGLVTAGALSARDGTEVRPGQEFLGMAAASAGAGLLSGYPPGSSDTRSFVVQQAGARSQLANVTAGVLTLLTLLVLTPLFRELPTSALGAVVMVSAAGMLQVRMLRRLWRLRRSDCVLALLTLVGVLVFGVLPGIGIGVAVSLAEVMRRALVPQTAVLGLVEGSPTYRSLENFAEAQTIPGVIVYRFDAALFFANADVLRQEVLALVAEQTTPVRAVVLNAEGIVDIDVTGAEILTHLHRDLADLGVALLLARVRTSVQRTLRDLGAEQQVGPDQFFLRVEEAVAAAAPPPPRE